VFPVAVIALAVVSTANAQSNASASVYRCKQANGAIAYQDYPCKGGVAVDIKPEHVDPTAIQRLRSAQAAFDQAYAERRAAEAAVQRRELIERPAAPPATDYGGAAPNAVPPPEYLLYGPLPRTNVDRGRPAMRPIVVPKRRIPATIRRPEET
jgi:hypothetical protein